MWKRSFGAPVFALILVLVCAAFAAGDQHNTSAPAAQPTVVVLATGGTIAGARARLDASGAVTGHGTVRLPSDVADGLRSHAPALGSFRDANGATTVPFGVDGSFDAPRFTLGRP